MAYANPGNGPSRGVSGGGGSNYNFSSTPTGQGNWNTGGGLTGRGSMDNGIVSIGPRIAPASIGPVQGPGIIASPPQIPIPRQNPFLKFTGPPISNPGWATDPTQPTSPISYGPIGGGKFQDRIPQGMMNSGFGGVGSGMGGGGGRGW